MAFTVAEQHSIQRGGCIGSYEECWALVWMHPPLGASAAYDFHAAASPLGTLVSQPQLVQFCMPPFTLLTALSMSIINATSVVGQLSLLHVRCM